MTYQMSVSISSLAASLAKAQGELSVASMNADNPFFKSKYADLGSVWDACRDALSKNGLSVIQNPTVSENGERVDLTTILAHGSGEWISSTVSSYIGNNQKLSHAQAIGSIITYLRRYSLASMVGVYAGDDNDGNEDVPKPRKSYAGDPQPTRQPITNGNGGKLPPNPEATAQNWNNAGGIGWDEMDTIPADVPAEKRDLFRGKVATNPRSTVGSVSSAAAATGAYRSDAYALNAARQWRDGLWIEDDKPAKSIPLHKDDALELFDWLIDRKPQSQQATQPELIEGVQAISPYGDDHSYRNS